MTEWNKKDLTLPPISTYRTLNNDIDLKQLKNICQDIKAFFGDNHYLQAEYLVLSRTIYRMKQKFNSSKDFKALEKVCKSMKLFITIDIIPHLETVIDLIPNKYKRETYLPSKNLLDFLLVKLQGISRLLKKVVENCKEAAGLLYTRIKIGHFWKVGIIVYSIISRIYILTKQTTHRVCEFYDKLILFSNKLQSTSLWLPKDYELPTDLKKWLNIDWLEFDEQIEIVDISTELSDIPLFDLVNDDDDDIEFCDEYILINDEKEMESEMITNLRGFELDSDIGNEVELVDSIIDISDYSLSGFKMNINKDVNNENVSRKILKSTKTFKKNNRKKKNSRTNSLKMKK